jgi:hypothetical protein
VEDTYRAREEGNLPRHHGGCVVTATGRNRDRERQIERERERNFPVNTLRSEEVKSPSRPHHL